VCLGHVVGCPRGRQILIWTSCRRRVRLCRLYGIRQVGVQIVAVREGSFAPRRHRHCTIYIIVIIAIVRTCNKQTNMNE
jgi:hypothetical protein